jgi:hypothetical protein
MSYRSKCLEQKGERCEECGSEENIVVHHIDGDRSNNEISNLAPLCHDCHNKVHKVNGELSEWSNKILPRAERTRQVTTTLHPARQRDADSIIEFTGAETHQEAIKQALEERSDRISEYRERQALLSQFKQIFDCDTDKEAVNRALKHAIEVHSAVEELKDHSELTANEKEKMFSKLPGVDFQAETTVKLTVDQG